MRDSLGEELFSFDRIGYYWDCVHLENLFFLRIITLLGKSMKSRLFRCFQNQRIDSLGQQCPIELFVMMKTFCVYTVHCGSH